MAETQPDFAGAWYCNCLPKIDDNGNRNFCPVEGCAKGYCARDAGWTPEKGRALCINSSAATDWEPFYDPR